MLHLHVGTSIPRPVLPMARVKLIVGIVQQILVLCTFTILILLLFGLCILLLLPAIFILFIGLLVLLAKHIYYERKGDVRNDIKLGQRDH